MSALTIASPQAGQRIYDQAITVSGSFRSDTPPQTVRVWSVDQLIGETKLFGRRDGDYRFRFLARIAAPANTESQATLRIRIDENATAEIPVTIMPARLMERAYGEVLSPDRVEILHRENIYGSGPPIEQPSGELVELLLQYLPPRSAVLDVGCGAGAYGPPLSAEGHSWIGTETDPACFEILSRRNLPYRRLRSGDRLPFDDRQFDAAMAIEVIEHIADLDAFVAELARVTRSRLLVSVPNMEVVPYFAPLGIVPWHLLEATHVNFFTRTSLRVALERHFSRVEVFSYTEHPVRTADNIPLHLHLFAIADKLG